MEINILGPYLHIYHFLQQWIAKGEEPSGTVIVLSSGAAGFTIPGFSAYPISKYANLRQVEVLNVEYPQVRAFAVHPGLVQTQMQVEAFLKQTVDTPELTGGLSLYLATEKAEHLRGRYVSVNWDVDEMEEHAAEIREKGLLHTSFLNAKLGPNGHPFEERIATP
jgi:NAD(P)-dependent dehydrogenase (short-subunit alcohol dehydrogenase family)